jgi:hypothetical protein
VQCFLHDQRLLLISPSLNPYKHLHNKQQKIIETLASIYEDVDKRTTYTHLTDIHRTHHSLAPHLTPPLPRVLRCPGSRILYQGSSDQEGAAGDYGLLPARSWGRVQGGEVSVMHNVALHSNVLHCNALFRIVSH